MNHQHFTSDQIAQALRDSDGLISYTAQKLNCSYSTVINYLERYPELKKIREELDEKNLDVSENQLFKQIKDGNSAAIFFHLKCKGKHRGYIERSEIEHSGSMKFTEEKRSETIEKIKDSLLNE
jgi:hypothetical protein